MADTSPALLTEERHLLAEARIWLKEHFGGEPDESYAKLDGKLILVDTILKNGWVDRTQTRRLAALGVAFGDALAQAMRMEWVTVSDEYGREPALNWPGTAVYIHPLSMIVKRVERGDAIDVQELFDATCSQVAMASGRAV